MKINTELRKVREQLEAIQGLVDAGRAIAPPSIHFSERRKCGWNLAVSLKDEDSKWFDPLALMREAIEEGGWEDDEVLKGIMGLRKLLRFMEREYRTRKNPSSPQLPK